MTLLWLAVWALICGAVLYLLHLFFDGEGEIERYSMGCGAILVCLAGWLITVYGWNEMTQDIIFAAGALAATGLVVVYSAHRLDATWAARKAQREAEEARIYQAGIEAGNDTGHSYPPVDQDI